MTDHYSITEATNELSTGEEDTNDIKERSVIIADITEDLPIEKLIKLFQKSALLENFDVYDYDKIQLTFLTKEETDQFVRDKGPVFDFEDFSLRIYRPDNIIVSPAYSSQSLEIKMIDDRRVVLTNIPKSITYEHLLLYLEYLSDEVGIEHVDNAHKDVKNSIVVQFMRHIDFNKMKQKHSKRPTFMNQKTDLLQIYEPKKVIVSFDQHDSFTTEILELYFSNKKRSQGENVIGVEINELGNQAVVIFGDANIAKNVANTIHQIDSKRIKVRLQYEVVSNSTMERSSEKFSFEEKITKELDNLSKKIINSPLHDKPEGDIPMSNDFTDMESTFDPDHLNPKQTNYLKGLQSIYNELNYTKLNLFKKKESPLVTMSDDKSIFSHYSNMNDSSNRQSSNIDSLLSLPKPSYESKPLVRVPDLDKSAKEMLFSTHETPSRLIPVRKPSIETKTDEISYYKGTLSHAEADVMYATSVIENSFKSCFECLDMDNNMLDEFTSSNKTENKILEDIKTISDVSPSIKSDETVKHNSNQSISSRKKANLPLRFARKYQLVKKVKNKDSKIVFKNRPRPPPPKIVKLNSGEQESDENLKSLNANLSKIHRKNMIENRSQSTYGHVNYYDKISLHKSDDETSTRTLRDNLVYSDKKSNNMLTPISQQNAFELKKKDMASLPDLRKVGKKSNHFKVDLAKKNLQSLYGKDTLSTSIDKLTPIQIDFFKTTKYLTVLKSEFPKVECNLNENIRNLYFFGTAKQVTDAKSRALLDLGLIKQTKFKLENKEIADFLKKNEVKQKILKFIETIMNRQKYHSQKGKLKNIGKSEGLINYCKYEIGSEVIMEIHEKNKKIENLSNCIYIHSNQDGVAEILKKLIEDSITVNKIYGIKSKRIVDYIKNTHFEWTDFFEKQFRNIIDFALKERILINKSISRTKRMHADKTWELRLTGFNEDVDKFIAEFETKFIEGKKLDKNVKN